MTAYEVLHIVRLRTFEERSYRLICILDEARVKASDSEDIQTDLKLVGVLLAIQDLRLPVIEAIEELDERGTLPENPEKLLVESYDELTKLCITALSITGETDINGGFRPHYGYAVVGRKIHSLLNLVVERP